VHRPGTHIVLARLSPLLCSTMVYGWWSSYWPTRSLAHSTAQKAAPASHTPIVFWSYVHSSVHAARGVTRPVYGIEVATPFRHACR
jgi:hypothetical protein